MDTLGQPLWVGQYRLTSRVATGGMAEVYVGRQISTDGQFGPMVAVKRLLPHLVKDSAIVRMFLNEARITAQIHHPNVVTIYELGQVEGEPFIAMELLEGRTWAELRQRAAEHGNRMPTRIALRVLTEACKGLDAAHRAVDEEGRPLALVHRDFTPDNIHVGVNGDVKVIDFGIARTTTWGSGTEPGTLKGKFFYMSPEMITAKPVDHRADIFAAGVMLYEQLCGRRPFTGSSVDEVVFRIAREEPLAPSTYDRALPKALEAVCIRAISKEPKDRHQSLAEFVEAIEQVGGDVVLASHEEVADYVSTLFPAKSDEKRDTLRRAREADPSISGMPGPSTPALGATSLDFTVGTLPQAVEPVVPSKKTNGRVLGALVAGALVVLAGGLGAWWATQRSAVSAAERLTKAEQLQGNEQAKALASLGTLPDVTENQLERAGLLLAQNQQWDSVLTLVDDWLLKNPKSFTARLLEAQAAVHTRKGKRAETAVREASALAPDDARPDAVLAELRELQADSNGALEAWTRAVAKAPKEALYLARQGYWLSQSGRLDEAESALSRAHKKRPEVATAAELGFVKFRKGQREDALRLLRAVVKDAPELMEGHYYLATVLFRRNDLAGARAEYLAADALAGADSRPLTALCEMEHMQRTSEMEAAKKLIRERFPKEADALLARCTNPHIDP